MAEQGTGGDRVAIITGAGGLRFNTEIRGHTVVTDQPERGGGTDTAPTPLDLLPVALGSCIILYAHQFCAARKISDEGLRVEVRWETANAPKRISRFDVRVILPDGLPDEYRAAIERAVLACPVHNTLAHAPELNIELLAAAGVR
jgi:putative redox protein